ncbi:MAG: hypothetical protein PHW93_04850 [Candidatus Methanomethylophilaceae archaeon]|nr:hypothetical protein [Candidatus Methanomethylophilaceae archaeon]
MATMSCALMERLDDFARFLSPGRHMRIPKTRVRDPSADGWKEVLLYLPMKGSVRSYRKGCLHIHDIEEEDCWDLHLDKVDPEQDPVRHLLSDAPVLILSAAFFVASALLMAKFGYRGPF